MERRVLEDRRTKDVRGVTGYDRRKLTRREMRGDAASFTPQAPSKYTEPQSNDLDFTLPKRLD